MKLAISNIAWTNEEEPEVAELLKELGVKYIEIAPTKTWDEPIRASDEEIASYADWWKSKNIEVVAFQSMLFSHPDYTLFDSLDITTKTVDYLKDFTELAAKIGAQRLVFGSPKNRQKGALSKKEADEQAIKIFSQIGAEADKLGVVFCLEPNAEQYNCDYITNAAEGIDLVQKVNSQGFGLHLDIACMTLAGDDVEASILASKDSLKHFHVSSPMLGKVEDLKEVDHRSAAKALRDIGYSGYISIEMRPGDNGTNVQRVKDAVQFVKSVYTPSL